jgi:hypothetical protein
MYNLIKNLNYMKVLTKINLSKYEFNFKILIELIEYNVF